MYSIKLRITYQTGKGNKDIVHTYGSKVFEISQHILKVKIPFNKIFLESTEETTTNEAKKVIKTSEENVISLISTNNQLTKIQMAALLDISKTTLERIIKKSQKIYYVGPKKGGHWVVSDKE